MDRRPERTEEIVLKEEIDMKKNYRVSTDKGGIGCLTTIGIVFVILKLTGAGQVAEWSWWWVLAPFWLPVAFGFAVISLIGFGWLCFRIIKRLP